MEKLYRAAGFEKEEGKSKTKWEECEGTKVKIEGLEECNFYFVKNVDFGHGKIKHCFIEEKTGMSIGEGKSKKECLEYFQTVYKQKGKDFVIETITKYIEKYGVSPICNS